MERGSLRRFRDWVRGKSFKRDLLGLGLAAGFAAIGAGVTQGRAVQENQSQRKELEALRNAIEKYDASGDVKHLPEKIRLPRGNYVIPYLARDGMPVSQSFSVEGEKPFELASQVNAEKRILEWNWRGKPEIVGRKEATRYILDNIRERALDKVENREINRKSALYDYALGAAFALGAVGIFGASRKKRE